MQKLSLFFSNNYKFTLVLTFFVLLYGINGLLNIKSEAFPSVNLGAVVITTRYDGATAEDIEAKITKPIEEEVQKVTGLKKVKSISQAGFSTIVTEVDIDKYDPNIVIADLQRAVDRASGLPTDLVSKPLFTEIKSDEFPVIEVAVVGASLNRERDEVADLLQEELRDNKKISSVSMTGFRKRQFNILLDTESLVKNHVSLGEVNRALVARNVTIPGGELKNEAEQKLLRIEGKALSVKELEGIVVRSNFSGQKVFLRDIARVIDGAEDSPVLARHNGQPATLLTITKKGGADLLDLAKEIEVVLAQFSTTYKGQFEFAIYNNEAVRVSDRLDVLISNGWQGLILVLVVLMLFLRGRVGFVAALSLPIALFTTIGLIYSMGYTLNTITIIGLIIALGMLVDNSVVIAENYVRLKAEGEDTDRAIARTIKDLWAPIAATALTTVAAFLPMLVTKGVLGQFIKGIPIVVSLALIISLLEAYFLMPTRLKLVQLKQKVSSVNQNKKDWFDAKVLPIFERQVSWLVLNKYKSTLIFTSLFVASVLLIAFGTKFNLFPSDQTEIYVGRIELPKGSRVEETDRVISEIQGQVQVAMQGHLKHVVQTAGRSSLDVSDPKGEVGSNTAMFTVFVNRETQNNVPTEVVLGKLRSVKSEKVSRMTWEALANGPPVGDPVTVTFRSNDVSEINKVTQQIKSVLEKTTGVFDVRIDDVFGDEEVDIAVDYEKAARLGLSLQDIGLTVRAGVAGQITGDVNLNNRSVDYVLRFDDQDRTNLAQLGQFKIADIQGNFIPLSNVADFDVKPGSPQIKRFDFRRAKTVTANIDDNVISSIKANAIVAEEFEKIRKDHPTVSLVFAGEAESTNESVQSLFSALILSLIGIFALMVLLFRSFSSPFIILSTIPLGLVGVGLAFTIQQNVLSFMALIGIIGVGGIIVNAGIILIAYIEQLKSETKLSLNEILVQASTTRLRPVVVTTATSILGLVPTAYGIGGVDYFIIPMAMSILWGLSAGTILTLYWVPPAYAIVNDLKTKLGLARA